MPDLLAVAPDTGTAGDSLFGSALAEMDEWNCVWGPRSFRDYVLEQGGAARRPTPDYISVDHHHKLAACLRRHDTMVLRLGDAEGTGTQFALVRVSGRLNDFFFFDTDLFGSAKVETFLPDRSIAELYAFTLLGSTSENNLLSLASAAGILNEALGIDRSTPVVPATGRSRFSFSFVPHSALDARLEHRNGQVEVDALFVARQNGRPALFVVEAKVGTIGGSLARHKLAYGCLPARATVPDDMPVFPVYLKIDPGPAGIDFNIAMFDPFDSALGLDEFRLASVRRLRLPRSVLDIGETGAS